VSELSGPARTRAASDSGWVAPPIVDLATARLQEGDRPWRDQRVPLVAERVRARLKQLAARLEDAEWLDGGFSAGDLLMGSVLLWSRWSGIRSTALRDAATEPGPG
jgi:glutathione S-transferase